MDNKARFIQQIKSPIGRPILPHPNIPPNNIPPLSFQSQHNQYIKSPPPNTNYHQYHYTPNINTFNNNKPNLSNNNNTSVKLKTLPTKPTPLPNTKITNYTISPTPPITSESQQDDILCEVCFRGDTSTDNDIVFCSKCDIAVHQQCYGISIIPEGDWLCTPCQDNIKPTCCMCLKSGGPLKRTDSSSNEYMWAHLSCALWIPETWIQNTLTMEPIMGVTRISRDRLRLICSICKIRGGVCIQCCVERCITAFHLTCAREAHYRIECVETPQINSDNKPDDFDEFDLTYIAFCPKHLNANYASTSLCKKKQKRKSSNTKKKSSKKNNSRNKSNLPRPPSASPISSPRESDFDEYEYSDAEFAVSGSPAPQEFPAPPKVTIKETPNSFWRRVNEYFVPLNSSHLEALANYSDTKTTLFNSEDPSFFFPPAGVKGVYYSYTNFASLIAIPPLLADKNPNSTDPLSNFENIDSSLASTTISNNTPSYYAYDYTLPSLLPRFTDDLTLCRRLGILPSIISNSAECSIDTSIPIVDTATGVVNRRRKHKSSCACACCFHRRRKQLWNDHSSLFPQLDENQNQSIDVLYLNVNDSLSYLSEYSVEKGHDDRTHFSVSRFLPTKTDILNQDQYDEIFPKLLECQNELIDVIKQNNINTKIIRQSINDKDLITEVNTQIIDNQKIESQYRIMSKWQAVRLSLQHGARDIPFSNTLLNSDAGNAAQEQDDDDIENATCFICFDGESTDSNPIIFCERCNISVHKACYGINAIPEGDWFCQYCKLMGPTRGKKADTSMLEMRKIKELQDRNQHRCVFCPVESGAFKRCADLEGRWAHVPCAIWLHSQFPQIRIGDIVTMEPIFGAKEVLGSQTEKCYICGEIYGLCLKCELCSKNMHPLCAWFNGNYMCVKNKPNMDITDQECLQFQCYCEDHIIPDVPGRSNRQVLQQRALRHHALSGVGRRDRQSKSSRGLQLARDKDEDIYPYGKCCVCLDGHENIDNKIVHCFRCEIDVHQMCYGILDHLPHRRWVCKRCESKQRNTIVCALCPRKGGAFKPTTDGRWVHIVCAMWNCDTQFVDPDELEPVRGVSQAIRQRKMHICYLCKRIDGICIKCSEKCGLFFHPLCNLLSGAHMKVVQTSQTQTQCSAFCRRHTPVTKAKGVLIPKDFSTLTRLRRDMDNFRMLLDLCRRREKQKKSIQITEHEIFEANINLIEEKHARRIQALEKARERALKQNIPSLNTSHPSHSNTSISTRDWHPTHNFLESIGQNPIFVRNESKNSNSVPQDIPNDKNFFKQIKIEKYQNIKPKNPSNVPISSISSTKKGSISESSSIRPKRRNQYSQPLPKKPKTSSRIPKSEAEVLLEDIMSHPPQYRLLPSDSSTIPRNRTQDSKFGRILPSREAAPKSFSQVPSFLFVYDNENLRPKLTNLKQKKLEMKSDDEIFEPTVKKTKIEIKPETFDDKVEENQKIKEPTNVFQKMMQAKPISKPETKTKPKKKSTNQKNKVKSEPQNLEATLPKKEVYTIGDNILVRTNKVDHAPARILNSRFDPDDNDFSYFVHYLGWNKRHDEWISPMLIVEYVDHFETQKTK